MITVGTDCSGIEAPLQALKNLNVNYQHIFSSEIDKYAQESLHANYSPKYFYTDIKDREFHYVDLYVCGYPCQSFSLAGLRKKEEDPRGQIFDHVFEYIDKARPGSFILENVKGLMSCDYFNVILDRLKSLKEYKVFYKLLNTKDYGIPQSRPRVYIIGTKKDFTFPLPVPMRPINDFIDYTNTIAQPTRSENKDFLIKLNNSEAVFLDLSWRNFTQTSNKTYSPCITKNGQLYNLKLKRHATVKEYLMLQGFPIDFKQVVSNSQLKKQIGNSMSVNVLEKLIARLII